MHLDSFQYLSKHAAPVGYFTDCWCHRGLLQESHPKQIKESYKNFIKFEYFESLFRLKPQKMQLITTQTASVFPRISTEFLVPYSSIVAIFSEYM